LTTAIFIVSLIFGEKMKNIKSISLNLIGLSVIGLVLNGCGINNLQLHNSGNVKKGVYHKQSSMLITSQDKIEIGNYKGICNIDVQNISGAGFKKVGGNCLLKNKKSETMTCKVSASVIDGYITSGTCSTKDEKEMLLMGK
jgi:hypothetical protein